ncbi:MAG: pyridoxal phosphate-dependent aminotransferase, partial [Bacteroidia bacterium]|nr:pyridoxal phosphate-dependent aminotransferase [Bacteroidia bacterium]
MPILSNRAQAMPASPIRKLVPFAEQAKRDGKHVYHLNIGQPDIETPDVMLNALKNMDMKVVEYSHSAGIESYRKKLVKYYADNDIHVDYTDIMVTTGGSEALEFAVMCSLDDGDEIIIPEPFYANYNGMVIEAGAKVVSIRSTIDTGFALPAIEEFEKVITSKTKAIIICNPSNPTGYLYTKEEIEQLRDVALKHNLFIIVDEVYREFCYDNKTHHSIMEYDELKDHAILIDSISKRYSACGARIGTLVSRNNSFMDAALKLAQARLSPPSFGQLAAEAALDVKPEYFAKVKTEYSSRRDFLVDALNKIEGVICPKPSGAFYCFV